MKTKAEAVQAGCSADLADRLEGLFPGLNWAAILALAVKYGPQLWTILQELLGGLNPVPPVTP